jgi:hypothetical protein
MVKARARRVRTCAIVIVVLCIATPGYTQATGRLIGFYFSSTPDLRAVAIDPSSGATSPIGSIATTGFLLGATAYDPVHRLEFIGRTSTTLLKMNVDTGASTSVSLSQPVELYAVDEASGVLYGLGFNGSTYELLSVDVSSGAVTSLFVISAAHSGWVPGTAAFDPFRKLFYYVDSTSLIEVNIGTHVSRAVAVEPKPYALVFDRFSRQLFGFVFGGTNGQVVRVDPATGSSVVVATLPGNTLLNQARALDPVTRRFFVLQPSQGLVAANVDTGAVSVVALVNDFYILEYDAGPVDLAAAPLGGRMLLLLAVVLAATPLIILRRVSYRNPRRVS